MKHPSFKYGGKENVPSVILVKSLFLLSTHHLPVAIYKAVHEEENEFLWNIPPTV